MKQYNFFYILQHLFFLFFFLFSFTRAFDMKSISKVSIETLERKVDLRSQYVQYTNTLKIINDGETQASYFYYTIPQTLIKNLYLFQITQGAGKKTQELQFKIIDDLDLKLKYNVALFEVILKKPIAPAESTSLSMLEYYYDRMTFLPKQITLLDDQFALFEDNAYLFSPYPIANQKITYKLSSSPISFTEGEGSSKQGGTIEYGSYYNVKSFSSYPIKLHFENNNPFPVLKSVIQTIEVSHWGNIAIEGNYKLKNQGAELTGEYGRVDYGQLKPNNGKNALTNLKADLPYHAWGVYYTDDIGNVSTSHAYRDSRDKQVKLEIIPRFSIFGGWHTKWNIGYNLPVHHYLYRNSKEQNIFTLKQQFGFPFEKLVAEEYELRVVLPEGATNIKAELPFDVDEESQTKTYGYLDIQGKPTLVFKKKLVSDFHYKQFHVTYQFDNTSILLEPILIFAAFFIFFMSLIILKRIEFKSFKSE